jgi:hypothetical protein
MLRQVYPASLLVLFVYYYYSYIVEFCFFKLIKNDVRTELAICLITVFHSNYFLILWCALVIVNTPNTQVSLKHRLRHGLLKRLSVYKLLVNVQDNNKTSYQAIDFMPKLSTADNQLLRKHIKKNYLKIRTRNFHGDINICLKCMLIKPDRCHHCSKCNKCILKMDHHCVWLNCCIEFSNQKCFTLLLIYAFMLLLFVFFSIFQSFSDCWNESFYNHRSEYHIFILFNLTCSFILPLAVLLVHNLKLVLTNRTSVEDEYPYWVANSLGYRKNIFDLKSFYINYAQVFGHNILLAMLPIWTTIGDGHCFPSPDKF